MALCNFVQVYYQSMAILDDILYPGYHVKELEKGIEEETEERRRSMLIITRSHDENYRATLMEKEMSEKWMKYAHLIHYEKGERVIDCTYFFISLIYLIKYSNLIIFVFLFEFRYWKKMRDLTKKSKSLRRSMLLSKEML